MTDKNYIQDKRMAIQMETLLLDIAEHAVKVDLHGHGAYDCIVPPYIINNIRDFFKMEELEPEHIFNSQDHLKNIILCEDDTSDEKELKQAKETLTAYKEWQSK